MIRRLRRGLADLLAWPVLWIPGRVGSAARRTYYRLRGATIGRGVQIDVGVQIDRPDRISVGDRSWLDRYAVLIAGEPRAGRESRVAGSLRDDLIGRIVVGAQCHIGAFTVLSGIGGLSIGDDSTISAGSKVYSLSHHYRSWDRPWDRSIAFGSQVPDGRQSMLIGPVVIETNVGIGANVLVLPGTLIARDSFVRPGAVVSGEWPGNSILGGHPAAREGDRYESPPG